MAERTKSNRRQRKSSSVGTGILCFFLGFLFAFIVLIGSVFGVGYVAATTDINEVLGVFGLQNKNEDYDESDPESNKYNYINADQAPNIYSLITEVIKLANEGLGEINFNKIDALAPVTDAVLDMAYGFIDDVVDFDKEYFEDVPLTSIIDSVKNSMYYVRMPKLLDMLNTKMGYSVSLDSIPIANYLINGIEAEYATVKGMDESFKLPVLFDYYVNDGSAVGYVRTKADPNGTSAYPSNFGGDYSFLQETTVKNADGAQLYKVYYVPCKITPTGIKEADYEVKKNVIYDPDVTFSKNGETVKLKYTFRTVEFGSDTDFVAVKAKEEDGVNVFELDYDAIVASRNTSSSATSSNRYVGYSYYESYARNYYDAPSAREENDRIYGVSTINHINYFKNVDGEIVEYDPLLVSDVMLNAMEPLNYVPVSEAVNTSQKEIVKDVFGDTSLGDIVNQTVNFNELINDVELSAFIKDVRADDKVMTFLVYNLSDVKSVGGVYTAIYDKGGDNIPVLVNVEGGVVKGLTNALTGEEVKGNTVANMNQLTNDLTVDVFMEVKASDALMLYLAYGITDAHTVVGEDYDYVGTIDGITAYIKVDTDGVVLKAVDAGGHEISGTKIGNIAEKIENITDVLSLPDFVDIDPSESVMAYIGYGLYSCKSESGTDTLGNAYSYTAKYEASGTEVNCYVSVDDEGNVAEAWYISGGERVIVGGTKIGQVSQRVDTLQDKMTIGELVTVDDSSSMILKALKDTTIGGLNDKINDLTVSDILTEEQINNNTILPQLKDTPVLELGDEIDKIVVQRIYAKTVYGLAADGDPTEATTFNSAYLYYEKDANGKLCLVTNNCPTEITGTADEEAYDNSLGKLTQSDWDNRGDKTYYTYGEAKGMWKLVLYRVDGDSKTEKAYTLNNFNNMVNSCATSVYSSTLGELKDAGIIAETTNLNKYLKVGTQYVGINAGGSPYLTTQANATMMKDLTLKQLLDAVITFIGSDS